MTAVLAGTGIFVLDEEPQLTAAALEIAGARRYRYLAAWWEAQGNKTLTHLFDWLAAREQEHVKEVLARCPRAAAGPLLRLGQPPSLGDTAWRSALKTPEQALAFALQEEDVAARFYTELAAGAATAPVQAWAANLARAERGHTAILRDVQRAGVAGLPNLNAAAGGRPGARSQAAA